MDSPLLVMQAPEIGTYNDEFGWGTGVEMTGVMPDIEVDNNPRSTFAGRDEQLERAILELKSWLEQCPQKLGTWKACLRFPLVITD